MKMSLKEALVWAIKFWIDIRDKGYNHKWEVVEPSLLHVLDMECKCPLCDYQRQSGISNFCNVGCPLANCTQPGQPYQDWFVSATTTEKVQNADRVVKQLKRYYSRVIKKKLVLN